MSRTQNYPQSKTVLTSPASTTDIVHVHTHTHTHTHKQDSNSHAHCIKVEGEIGLSFCRAYVPAAQFLDSLVLMSTASTKDMGSNAAAVGPAPFSGADSPRKNLHWVHIYCIICLEEMRGKIKN
jgi:hypothetical protein